MGMKVVVTPLKEGGTLVGDFTKQTKSNDTWGADEKSSAVAADVLTERIFLLDDGERVTIEAKTGRPIVYDQAQSSARLMTEKEERALRKAEEQRQKEEKEREKKEAEELKKEEEEEKKEAAKAKQAEHAKPEAKPVEHAAPPTQPAGRR
jgi:hypothetical protein